jgi:phosphoribosyl 1,2-cyclic phosphodiesterase
MIEFIPYASSSKGNCYTINDGNTKLLIECGIGFKEIQHKLNFKTSDIAGCLISHSHADHSRSVQEIARAGIDLYVSWDTAEEVGITGHRVNIIEALRQFKIGTWLILPFDVIHDVSTLGFLFQNKEGEKFIYITDTAYCKYRFNGLTGIAIEVNHDREIIRHNSELPEEHKRRLMRSHMSLQVAKEFLRANDLSRVDTIYLLHLSDGNSDEQRFKREIQALTGKLVMVAQA